MFQAATPATPGLVSRFEVEFEPIKYRPMKDPPSKAEKQTRDDECKTRDLIDDYHSYRRTLDTYEDENGAGKVIPLHALGRRRALRNAWGDDLSAWQALQRSYSVARLKVIASPLTRPCDMAPKVQLLAEALGLPDPGTLAFRDKLLHGRGTPAELALGALYFSALVLSGDKAEVGPAGVVLSRVREVTTL